MPKLKTLYLDVINFQVCQNVKKEEKIGASGLTGLAGGDHLHFSIIVGGQFVNPQEWWDPHWIEDNVMKKMAIQTQGARRVTFRLFIVHLLSAFLDIPVRGMNNVFHCLEM